MQNLAELFPPGTGLRIPKKRKINVLQPHPAQSKQPKRKRKRTRRKSRRRARRKKNKQKKQPKRLGTKKKTKSVKMQKRMLERRTRDEGLKKRIQRSNVGFQLLEKMGYRPGMGLGVNSQGRVDPPAVNMKNLGTSLHERRSGIGKKGKWINRKKARQHKTTFMLAGIEQLGDGIFQEPHCTNNYRNGNEYAEIDLSEFPDFEDDDDFAPDDDYGEKEETATAGVIDLTLDESDSESFTYEEEDTQKSSYLASLVHGYVLDQISNDENISGISKDDILRALTEAASRIENQTLLA